MKDLVYSGLPIKMDDDSFKLSMGDSLFYSDTATKYSDAMFGLLYDDSYKTEEPFYDFYKGIVFEKDKKTFEENGLRYDITIIMPGMAGIEYKKTSGHYHEQLLGKNVPHPEIYEVISGKAMFVLQKVNDMYADQESIVVEEVLIAEVSEGEKIIIPPAYGHVSINVGDGPLVFADLVADKGTNTYDSVKAHKGMSYYVIKKDDKTQAINNPLYKDVPSVKFIKPSESQELGISFDTPIYDMFIKSPEKFEYLLNPTSYIGKMDELLVAK